MLFTVLNRKIQELHNHYTEKKIDFYPFRNENKQPDINVLSIKAYFIHKQSTKHSKLYEQYNQFINVC